jgi:hypothetical protein
MLSVNYAECCKQVHYAECRYAKCRGAVKACTSIDLACLACLVLRPLLAPALAEVVLRT